MTKPWLKSSWIIDSLEEAKLLIALLETSEKSYDLEVVLSCREIGRIAKLSMDEAWYLGRLFKENGIACFLQWDILMTENVFVSTSVTLKSKGLFSKDFPFSGIRVQDAGALYWLKDNNFPKNIHYICENGNHNISALKGWYGFWPERISRLVLSPELTASTLREYRDKLECELEVLAWGPLLLFYTPRGLLSPQFGDSENTSEDLRVLGTSEESPHRGFPLIENSHGTFMFNTKDQFSLGDWSLMKEVSEGSSFHWRFDFSDFNDKCGLYKVVLELFSELVEGEHLNEKVITELLSKLKVLGPRPVIKGFFKTNKTDVLFKKLKNSRLQDRTDTYIGDIVDVKKKKYLGLHLKSPTLILKKGNRVRLLSPEGNEKLVVVNSLRNAVLEEVDEVTFGDVAFISHVGGISVRTMAYLDTPDTPMA